METTEKTGYFKCPKCGAEYYTDDLTKFDFECTHCGNVMAIRGYYYCPECDKQVGIQEKPLTIKKFGNDCVETVKMMLRPRKLIKSIVEESRLPLGDCYVCPFCKTRYAVCPHCETRVDGAQNIKAGDEEVMFCPECGSKFIINGYDE